MGKGPCNQVLQQARPDFFHQQAYLDPTCYHDLNILRSYLIVGGETLVWIGTELTVWASGYLEDDFFGTLVARPYHDSCPQGGEITVQLPCKDVARDLLPQGPTSSCRPSPGNGLLLGWDKVTHWDMLLCNWCQDTKESSTSSCSQGINAFPFPTFVSLLS